MWQQLLFSCVRIGQLAGLAFVAVTLGLQSQIFFVHPKVRSFELAFRMYAVLPVSFSKLRQKMAAYPRGE